MRLKPEKIEQLAGAVYDALAANSEVAFGGDRDKIVHDIKAIITGDLAEEDRIEAEARKILEAHADDIRRMSVSYDQMLRKTMRKLAADKGMVI
jgi:hypothetical protein